MKGRRVTLLAAQSLARSGRHDEARALFATVGISYASAGEAVAALHAGSN